MGQLGRVPPPPGRGPCAGRLDPELPGIVCVSKAQCKCGRLACLRAHSDLQGFVQLALGDRLEPAVNGAQSGACKAQEGRKQQESAGAPHDGDVAYGGG